MMLLLPHYVCRGRIEVQRVYLLLRLLLQNIPKQQVKRWEEPKFLRGMPVSTKFFRTPRDSHLGSIRIRLIHHARWTSLRMMATSTSTFSTLKVAAFQRRLRSSTLNPNFESKAYQHWNACSLQRPPRQHSQGRMYYGSGWTWSRLLQRNL
jgi:hypothetical protein